MNKRCATCGWWTFYDNYENFVFGRCEAPDINKRSWMRNSEIQILIGETDDDTDLITREDFGCTLHEEREENV